MSTLATLLLIISTVSIFIISPAPQTLAPQPSTSQTLAPQPSTRLITKEQYLSCFVDGDFTQENCTGPIVEEDGSYNIDGVTHCVPDVGCNSFFF